MRNLIGLWTVAMAGLLGFSACDSGEDSERAPQDTAFLKDTVYTENSKGNTRTN